MKQTTRFSTFLFLIALSASVSAAEIARVFQGQRGAILLFESGNEQKVMVAGGALPNGPATSGDCFAEANLNLKKTPNYYEGDFESVHNEIVDVGPTDVQGKGIGIYKFDGRIQVGGAEVSGICADGIDFSGVYREIPRKNSAYERNFLYFLNLSHQNANFFLKHSDPKAAAASLKPFVETYDGNWIESGEAAKVIVPAINDYAFALQEIGDDTAALPLFKTVIRYQPNRTVAWLNMADSYWSTNDRDNARKCYRQYAKLMTAAGMQTKIPSRVIERTKSP